MPLLLGGRPRNRRGRLPRLPKPTPGLQRGIRRLREESPALRRHPVEAPPPSISQPRPCAGSVPSLSFFGCSMAAPPSLRPPVVGNPPFSDPPKFVLPLDPVIPSAKLGCGNTTRGHAAKRRADRFARLREGWISHRMTATGFWPGWCLMRPEDHRPVSVANDRTASSSLA